MRAILVINEMPSACDECPCCYEIYCPHLGREFGIWEYHAGKPVDCPLRPLPKLLEEEIDMGLDPSDDSPAMHYKRGLCHGWRGCLNNILGDNDESNTGS